MQAKKERNHAIDFFRFLFSIGFVIGHMAIILGRLPGRESGGFTFALDTLAVFICIAGYFMMAHYRKTAAIMRERGVDALGQAWDYLKSRIRGIGVWYLVGNITGFVGLCLWNKTPVTQWFDAFLNHLGEFCGLMLSGFGYGTNIHGLYGTASSEYTLINGPLWFVSGLFICSFVLYYMIARDERKTVCFVVPITAILFYGSLYLMPEIQQPFWHSFLHFGDFNLNVGLVDMFCNLGLGCLMYVGVEALREREFSRPFYILVTVVQTFLLIFIPFRTLGPTNVPWNPFSFGWGSSYLLALLFTFLLVLNKDGATKFINRKALGALGHLSMYVYVLHYSVIILVYVLAPWIVETSVPLYVGLVIAIVIAISVIAARLDRRIQPWLASEPWFKK